MDIILPPYLPLSSTCWMEILAKGSTGNGQIRYGADVINRIIESVKPGGKEKLQKSHCGRDLKSADRQYVRSCEDPLQSGIPVYIATNTTMNHLLLGVDSDPVRMEPYIPTFFKTNSVYASDIGVKINPDAHLSYHPTSEAM